MTSSETILVVDDHDDLLENLALALEAEGYQVLTARDGLEALVKMENSQVDLIIADIAMPKMNGYQLFDKIRENPAWVRIPYLLLSARAMDSDVRYGKELGVDDYLIKPIQPEDLLAVVRGKLKRAEQLATAKAPEAALPTGENGKIKLPELEINPDHHQAWYRGEKLNLSAREFTLLEYLARKPGHVVSAQELIVITHGFETDHVEAGSLLRPLIRSLRRKLGYDVGEYGPIENIRGVGYRLKAVPED